MDKIKNAAIIILGMGEKCASEILKNMSPKEVRRIMEAVSSIEEVSEKDVIQALNSFFKASNNDAGIDFSYKENIKNSLSYVLGMKGVDGANGDVGKWIELLKTQPIHNIVDLIADEHPQIITAVIVILTKISSDKASKIIKQLPKELQTAVIKKMTTICPISTYAIDTLSTFFEKLLETSSERYNVVSVDGVEAAANIISSLDIDSEREIITDLITIDKAMAERIQEKILPFDRIAQLDSKSLQTLLKEIDNDDLVLALKGADDYVKNIVMKNMSNKSAEILKDELETKGPVKLSNVIEAQKKIIMTAKKLAEEEKIILSSRHDNDVIF
jgi:flagellar motor switch protein FliG